MFIAIALLAMSAFLAGANGANDVSKGVATLVGSGVASYRKAVWWGSVWTVGAGSWILFASRTGLPVSTTHVSTGAIFGIGFWRGGQGFQWGMVKGILLAWLVTLPCSALLGIGAYWLFS